MTSDEEHIYTEEILGRLDQELSTDAASAEYYISMPFDERLDLLLEAETPTISIDAAGVSSHLANRELFPPNDLAAVDVMLDEHTLSQIEVEAFTFRLQGTMSLEHKKIELKAQVISNIKDTLSPTFIQNIPGSNEEFVALRSTEDGFVSETLDLKGLFYLLGSIADIDRAGMTSALKKIEHNGELKKKYLRMLLVNTWSLIGFKMGSKKETRTIAHTLPVEDPMYSECIKLEQVLEEKTDESILHFTLERTKAFESLDIEDTHSLVLEFSSDPAKADHTILSQTAKRIVASGVTPLALVSVNGTRNSGGRETRLNLNDPEVITLFVDWFDQLVSA